MNKFPWVRRFAEDRGGNAAIAFGLASVPAAMLVVMGLEFSETTTDQNELQNALDAATLAAASEVGRGNTESFSQVAQNVFNANFPGGETLPLEVNFDLNAEAGTVTGQAKVLEEASVSGLINEPVIEISASAEATIGTDDTTVVSTVFSVAEAGEVVFIMDYSGSMADPIEGESEPKFKQMAEETERLINNLTEDQTRSNVKVSLVPFAQLVLANLPRKHWFDQSGSASGKLLGCTLGRLFDINRSDSTPVPGFFNNTNFVRARSSSTFNVCVNQFNRDLQLRDLSTDYSGTIQQVRDMRPGGLTNISVGMEMAYHVLSPNKPFNEGSQYDNDNVSKIAVLLTDGAQTAGGYGPGNGFSVSNANANFEAICENMRDDGIRVITISYDLDDAATNSRLEACASPITAEDEENLITTNFYTAQNAAELSFVFGQINQSLGEVTILSSPTFLSK